MKNYREIQPAMQDGPNGADVAPTEIPTAQPPADGAALDGVNG